MRIDEFLDLLLRLGSPLIAEGVGLAPMLNQLFPGGEIATRFEQLPLIHLLLAGFLAEGYPSQTLVTNKPPNSLHLSSLNTKTSYRTGRNDLVQDFFVPCLSVTTVYRRAAGYFSSHGLALAARGVAKLVANRGEMRLVVSPHLDPQDISALQGALDQPVRLLSSFAARAMVDVEDALVRDRLNALAWLAAAGILKIRLPKTL